MGGIDQFGMYGMRLSLVAADLTGATESCGNFCRNTAVGLADWQTVKCVESTNRCIDEIMSSKVPRLLIQYAKASWH